MKSTSFDKKLPVRKAQYAGCRPVKLTSLLQKAGFTDLHREVIIQLAFPSEILVATK